MYCIRHAGCSQFDVYIAIWMWLLVTGTRNYSIHTHHSQDIITTNLPYKALGRKLAPDEKLWHQQIVSTLQAIVLCKRSELTCTINSLEHEQFSHYNRLPLDDPNCAHLVAVQSYVTKLLHKWEKFLFVFYFCLTLHVLHALHNYCAVFYCIIVLCFCFQQTGFSKSHQISRDLTNLLTSYWLPSLKQSA